MSAQAGRAGLTTPRRTPAAIAAASTHATPTAPPYLRHQRRRCAGALGFASADVLVLAKMANTQALRRSYAAGRALARSSRKLALMRSPDCRRGWWGDSIKENSQFDSFWR